MSDREADILEAHHERVIPTGAPEVSSAKRMKVSETGVHSIVPKIVIGASAWFLFVTWLSFAWGGEIDFLLAIVILFFGFFFLLFLFTASYTLKDPRWAVRETSFRDFLGSEVGTGSGTMRGRDVLIEVTLIPVALAFAATLIGIAWLVFR
ncbi:MAG: hypothetical protein ACREDO_13445 [Methyloceanibacter sp.]